MLKSTALSGQFMTRTGNFSTHGSRSGLDLLGVGAGHQESMDPRAEREAMAARIRQIQAQLEETNRLLTPTIQFKEAQRLKQQKAALGEEYKTLSEQIKSLNEAAKRYRRSPDNDMGACIIQVCRERMTKPQWELVMAEARRRFNALPTPPSAHQGEKGEMP